MSLAILFHFLCTQHVSDINISIIKELVTVLLNYHIGRSVLGSLCVGELVRLGLSGVRVADFSLQTENKTTDVVIQQHSLKLLDDGYINVRNMLST